ncbi:ABC transporter permease [Paenibacillus puerhi]|uniref:ABC transporter permease n=1 Tax=Paenibacillus puerhi TaxID=2692622 RepID=UPI0013586378|nr:ABC transporter permease [Paenibacillus puerhi]
MSLLSIAWRNLINRKIQTIVTIVVIAVGVAMTLSVFQLTSGIKEGIANASEPYGLLVGSKGSANQLVFNTIYLMDTPLGNLPHSYFEKLNNDPRIQTAVPFALGDNFKGFRLVGTSEPFFELRVKPKDPPYFQLSEGRIFNEPYEAVLGSHVAETLKLKVGDEFVSSHGVVSSLDKNDTHSRNPYKIVGIMKSLKAPADKGIYVNMESYWISHGQGEHEEAEDKNDELAENDEHENEHGVTAVLVKPNSYSDLMRLYQEINNSHEAQAVLPGQVLAKVFDMIGSGEALLRAISYIILAMAGFTILLSLYSSALERRRTIAILRSIGAEQSTVFGIVLLEFVIVVFLGAIAGLGLAFLVSYTLAYFVGEQSSINLSVKFTIEQLWLLLAVCLAGSAAGMVPAIKAYRTEVVKYLNAQ